MLKMRRGQGSRHFQISKAIFTRWMQIRWLGNGDRLVGVLTQAQIRRLPSSLVEPTLPLGIGPLALYRAETPRARQGVSRRRACDAAIHALASGPDSGRGGQNWMCCSACRKATRLDWVLYRQYSRYFLSQFGWPEGFWQQRHSRDALAEGADITSYQ